MAVKKYTVIGEGQAKVGYRFEFKAPAKVCMECERFTSCAESLKPGRVYLVKHVTFKRFACSLHGPDARLVEVEEAVYDANLESRAAMLNALITFQPVECDLPCPQRGRCRPTGLFEGDRCRIVEVGPTVHCLRGKKLSFVRLLRKLGSE